MAKKIFYVLHDLNTGKELRDTMEGIAEFIGADLGEAKRAYYKRQKIKGRYCIFADDCPPSQPKGGPKYTAITAEQLADWDQTVLPFLNVIWVKTPGPEVRELVLNPEVKK